MKFNSNPLSGLHFEGKNGKDGDKYIVDSNGNKVLERSGINWSEDDQIGYDLLMKSMDYQYQADLMNYQNEYNSYAQQVKRMREAGINPDFQNFTNIASASSNASAPTTELKEGQETERKIGYAQSFLQLLPEAINLYYQSKSSLQQLEMNQLQIDKEYQNMAYEDAVNFLSPSDFGTDGNLSDSSLLRSSDNYGRRLMQLGYNIDSRRNSRSSRRRVEQYNFALNELMRGNQERLRSGVYSRHSDSATNRSNFLNLLGQYGYNVDDDLFASAISEFNKALFSSQKKEAEKRGKLAENDVMANLMSRATNLIDSNNTKDQLLGIFLYFVGSLGGKYANMK